MIPEPLVQGFSQERGHEFSESKKWYIGGIRGGKGRKKLNNDIIISKLEEIIKRMESKIKMQMRKQGRCICVYIISLLILLRSVK